MAIVSVSRLVLCTFISNEICFVVPIDFNMVIESMSFVLCLLCYEVTYLRYSICSQYFSNTHLLIACNEISLFRT